MPVEAQASVERKLIADAIEGGDEARGRLVAAFQPLIGKIASLYRGVDAVSQAELMQEGVVGLLRALGRYDPGQGTPFWAYASWWVRQAMQQLVAELSRPVVLSDRAFRQLARVRQAEREGHRSGHVPASGEIARSTGFARDRVHSLITADRAPRALDAAIGPGGEGPGLVELLADPVAEQAYDRVETRLEIEVVRRLCGRLSERERTVLDSHYGLGRPARTLRQIGEELGVTAERVRQIEDGALEKLRRAVSAPAA
jgi:RNA polymerase primary sigma factor